MGTATIASKNNQALHLVAYSLHLPFPTNIEVGTQYNWNAESMGVGADLVKASSQGGIKQADLEAFVKRTGAKIGAAIGGDAFAQGLAQNKLALNPKEQVLFQGVSFRQYSLTWDLIPTSADESQAYADVIETMHLMAAPKLVDNATFFEYPQTTRVVLRKAGGRKIMDRPESAIIDINVGLTPDGIFSQLKDGRPVHTSLTVQFMELALPHKGNVPKLLG